MYEQQLDSGYDDHDKMIKDWNEHNSGDGAKDQFERLDEERSQGNEIVRVFEPHRCGGGYTLYKVKGQDEQGEFEVERRYWEF